MFIFQIFLLQPLFIEFWVNDYVYVIVYTFDFKKPKEKCKGGLDLYKWFLLFLKHYWLAEVNGEIFEYDRHSFTQNIRIGRQIHT